MTILDFQARAERAMAEHDRRIREPLELELVKARRALESSRATLTAERARYRSLIAALEDLERSAAASGVGREWYTAITALLRAQRAEGV